MPSIFLQVKKDVMAYFSMPDFALSLYLLVKNGRALRAPSLDMVKQLLGHSIHVSYIFLQLLQGRQLCLIKALELSSENAPKSRGGP